MGKIRSCQNFTLCNPNFIGISLALIIVYVLYVYQFYWISGGYMVIPWLILISISYLLSLWSYVAVVVIQPGYAPKYWGLYDISNQIRKYCLVCKGFKPERTHHCSKCNKCILNMDHHCPWINNCVGFQNRKYFILFIFYLLISLIIGIVQMLLVIYYEFDIIIYNQYKIHLILKIILVIYFVILALTLITFLVYHINMILKNSSTLDQMTRNKNIKAGVKEEQLKYIYDVGKYNNFTQVFGQNALYWLIPVEEQKKLRGRGVIWDKQTIVKS